MKSSAALRTYMPYHATHVHYTSCVACGGIPFIRLLTRMSTQMQLLAPNQCTLIVLAGPQALQMAPYQLSHHGENRMTPLSATSAWARARDRGAGPRTTLPSALYWEPWQGHLNLFSAC
eukprot:scaffold257189_cov17-Tisochrysis_lutea.AAC.1